MEATARHNILNSIFYKRKKWLPLSVRDRRKSLYQAVSAHLPTGNSAETAYLHCIKLGTNIDPACGTGGMLLQAINHVRDKGQDIRTLWLYGQERNLTTSAIARMNLIIHGLEDFYIKRGDTLRNPLFRNRNKLATFDCVIANPPFSLKNWGADIWEHDKWKRNEYGIPPAQYGDFAWVEHMLKSM